MAAPVVHINLLQRPGPRHTMAWALLAVLTATLSVLGLYGRDVWKAYASAVSRRDTATEQVTRARAQLADVNQRKARSADAIALRSQIDALEPQAQAARAVMAALRTGEAGDGARLGRCLEALSGMADRGAWITGVTLADGGRQIELQGEAQSAAAVLRFAQRANEILQPLAMRLDNLDMQPGPAGATLVFRLH